LGEFQPGDVMEIEFAIECLLTRQEYTLTAAMQHDHGGSQDWLDDVLSFTVTGAKDHAGLVALPTRITMRTPVSHS
jgi:hypothetical protein